MPDSSEPVSPTTEPLPSRETDPPQRAEPPRVKRRVGRPRRAEGPAVTREQIVREASASLIAHGMSGFVLRDIARRLNVSLPTLQQHFPTKDDLYRACIDELVSNIPVTPDSGLADSIDNASPLLSNFIRHLVERTVAFPRATAAMWNDEEPGNEERLQYLEERATPRADIARQNLAAAIGVGVFRPIDPEVFIALLALGISSIASSPKALSVMFGIELDNDEDKRRLVKGLTDILLYGAIAPEERRVPGTASA